MQDAEEETDEVDSEDDAGNVKARLVWDEAEDHADDEEKDGDDVQAVPGVSDVGPQFGPHGVGIVGHQLQNTFH